MTHDDRGPTPRDGTETGERDGPVDFSFAICSKLAPGAVTAL